MQSFHFRFRIQDLRTRNKLETFHSESILLYVNGQMNPVPKRSGVGTTHAQIPLLSCIYLLRHNQGAYSSYTSYTSYTQGVEQYIKYKHIQVQNGHALISYHNLLVHFISYRSSWHKYFLTSIKLFLFKFTCTT